jgi:3-isopropylmalate/(R)-2-methylmalate dehydratase large subunit
VEYSQIIEIDVSDLEPVVAIPHLPSNGKPATAVGNIPIDQAYLGSCTNGRIEDLRIAAAILKGRKIAQNTRMIIVPATTEIWKQANREGLLEIFTDAGATISTPTCGACLGGHMGVLAAGERCISSTNRNFIGRMGSPQSEVFLASPATVAASAIAGKIADPRLYLQENS